MRILKKLLATLIALAIVAGGGYFGYKKYIEKFGNPIDKSKVYVTKVSEVNTAWNIDLTGNTFAGLIEEPKTTDYKYDMSKTIAALNVKVGDNVKKGDVLFTYDVEAMKLELEQDQIELERMESDLVSNKEQLTQLEKDKAQAKTLEEKTSLDTQIISLKSDIARSEYDIKTKKNENKKKEKSIGDTEVKSEIDGKVKFVADITKPDNIQDQIIVKLSKGESYIIKGVVDEQMVDNLYKDMPVIIHSRTLSDQTWKGTISSIDTNPTKNSGGYGGMDEYGGGYDDMGDSYTSTSKYTFYIKPESLDGLKLGQHILIEPDFQIEEADIKEGVWLYRDYICTEEDGTNYVWAKNENNLIEKRVVTLGKSDENSNDVEIKSGLKDSDYIAYPNNTIYEGQKITDDPEDMNIPDSDFGNKSDMDNYGDNMEDYGGFDNEMGMDDYNYDYDEEVYDDIDEGMEDFGNDMEENYAENNKKSIIERGQAWKN